VAKKPKQSHKGAAKRKLGLSKANVKDLPPEDRQVKLVRGGVTGSRKVLPGNDQPPN